MRSVAVITATTGRDTLKKAAESVAAQTYPCQHYVFWDGVEPNVELPEKAYSIKLPIATGANKMMNGGICAAAAFLVKEDYICFLDDDNWFEPNHVESLMSVIGDNVYAYSLRNLIDSDGSFYCRDDGEAIGHYGDLVDVNCYMFHRHLATQLAPCWYHTNGEVMVGDRVVWDTLIKNKVPYAASGKYTVNYMISSRFNMKGYFFLKNIQKRAQYPDGYPWQAK